MHAKAVEIAWHDNAPIWSVDISLANRVVTASGDKVARVWRFNSDPHAVLSAHVAATTQGTEISLPSSTVTPVPTEPVTKPANPKQFSKFSKLSAIRSDAALVEWLCDLRAHATTINVARFSPDGLAIATAADLGEIVIWRLDSRPCEPSPLAPDDEQPKERWQCDVTLRGHVQDVLDLAWSADATRLVSASVDNAVMVWDLRNPARTPISLRNHANFVQGVTIDPFGRLIASMGNDRALRIFTANNTSWCQVASVSSIGTDSRLFIDDSKFKNFFRRLAWSPDGSVLACPSGIHLPKENKRLFAVHIFMRNHWIKPVIQCGGLPTPPGVVRFSPVLYQLRNSGNPKEDKVNAAPVSAKTPFHAFTYRMIFAVACVHSVVFYDTECLTRPFASVEGLHCAEHTDITWSEDGRTLLVSSMDGYISAICFSQEELGVPLPEEKIPAWLHKQEDVTMTAKIPQKECTTTVTKVVSVRPRPSQSVAPIAVETAPPTNTQKLPNSVNPKQVQRKRPLEPSLCPPPLGAPTSESPLKRLNTSTALPCTTKTASAHGYRIKPPTPNMDTKTGSSVASGSNPKPMQTGTVAMDMDLQCENGNTRSSDEVEFVSTTKSPVSEKPFTEPNTALQRPPPIPSPVAQSPQNGKTTPRTSPVKNSKQTPNGTPKRRNMTQKVQSKFFFPKVGTSRSTTPVSPSTEKAEMDKSGSNPTQPSEKDESAPVITTPVRGNPEKAETEKGGSNPTQLSKTDEASPVAQATTTDQLTVEHSEENMVDLTVDRVEKLPSVPTGEESGRSTMDLTVS